VLHPDCTVEDVTIENGVPRPHSSRSATTVGGTAPCWRLCNAADPSNAARCTPAELSALSACSECASPRDHHFQIVGVNIERGGVMAPANTTAKVACNTIAIANEDPNAACM